MKKPNNITHSIKRKKHSKNKKFKTKSKQVYNMNIIRNLINKGCKFSNTIYFEQALEKLNIELKNNPFVATKLYYKSKCLSGLSRLDEAETCIKNAIKMNRKVLEYKIMKADILYYKGKFEKSLKIYNKCLNIKPKCADAIFGIGKILMDTGKLNQAEKLLEQTIDMYPRWAPYHYTLGLILFKQKNYDIAIKSLDKAIELNPHNLEYIKKKAKYLNNLEKYSEMVSFLNIAVQRFPNEWSLYLKRGRGLYQLNNFSEAIEDFKKTMKNKHELDVSYNCVGLCFFYMKNYEKALHYFKLAHEENKEDLNFIFDIADTYFELNNWGEAEKICLELLQSKNSDEELEKQIKNLIWEIKEKKDTKNIIKICCKEEVLRDLNQEEQNVKIFQPIENNIENFEDINKIIKYKNDFQNLNAGNLREIFHLNCFTKKIPFKMTSNLYKELDDFFKLARQLKLENLISYYGYDIHDNYISVKMEMCHYDSLDNVYNRKEISSVKEKLKISLDCAIGLFYLHDNNLMHGNLKLNNVMIFKGLKTDQSVEINAKLSDYGIINLLAKSGSIDFDLNNFKNFRWRDPEFMNRNIDLKCDIYSFGILLWEIFSAKLAYAEYPLTPFQLIHKIGNEKLRPSLDELDLETSDSIRQLILRCWDDNRDNRPTSEEVASILNQNLILMS